MKINMPVTNVEQKVREEEDLITTTDRKGAITSANDNFVRISGFSSEELLHKNHNIVRHPEMPPAAFEDLWTNIKAGQPWMGIVKNRCKNGDYYWVDAFVMPISNGKEIVEYQSVRKAPHPSHVARAERLYKKINAGAAVKRRWPQFGLLGKLIAGFAAIILINHGIGIYTGNLGWGTAGIAAAGELALAFIIARYLASPLIKLSKQTRSIIDNPLSSQVYADHHDEIGQIQVALHMQDLKINSIVSRLNETSDQMATIVRDTSVIADETNAGIHMQQGEIEQVATAMNQLVCTVQEMTRNINQAAEAAKKADTETEHGKQDVAATLNAFNDVAHEITHASDVVGKLQQETDKIGSVLEVIRGVAEQTNLLALNAAIEAARAGEQGRGFAVVADEVRSLASRTQESTREIQHIIESVQSGAREAVRVMESGNKLIENSVQQVNNNSKTLDTIASVVNTISNMNVQNASATEEQLAVSEEVNRNISNISISANDNAERSNKTKTQTEELARFADHLRILVHQFGK